MLELLIVYGIVRAFVLKAREKKLNQVVWGLIGAGSYGIPVILLSFVVLPVLVLNGTLSAPNPVRLKIMLIVMTIASGAICSAIAYQILKRTSAPETGEDILDSNPAESETAV